MLTRAVQFHVTLVASLAVFSCRLSGSGLTSFSLTDGPHIVYLDAAQHVNQIWYTTSARAWSAQDLTATVAPGTPAASGSALTSFSITDGPHVVYVDAAQHINQFGWNGSTWTNQDVTALAGGRLPAAGSALTSFLGSDGPHIVYLDAAQHMNQVWYTTSANGWSAQDLTATVAPGTPAANGSALTSFSITDGPHVLYVDAAGNVNQFWYNGSPSSWTDQNLNSLASSGGTGQQSLVSDYLYLGNQLIAIEAGHP